jgi:hypothetical protein
LARPLSVEAIEGPSGDGYLCIRAAALKAPRALSKLATAPSPSVLAEARKQRRRIDQVAEQHDRHPAHGSDILAHCVNR